MKKLVEVKSMTSLPVISVGGIMSAEDAVERLKAGADRIQIYTGWIYGGPFFARKISRLISAVK
jgi:dihydroorotate dehydrogenase